MSEEKLAEWRTQIDDIDREMVTLLARRFQITREVGEWKAQNGVPPVDPEREKRQVARLQERAAETGLSADFLERFLRIIIDEVVSHHRAIRDEDFEAPDPL
ncbi:MAG: chorismate mutase [Sphingomonadaceae bacterium]|nr:chorismate mutase [Sphingomonadaceae bacterium]